MTPTALALARWAATGHVASVAAEARLDPAEVTANELRRPAGTVVPLIRHRPVGWLLGKSSPTTS